MAHLKDLVSMATSVLVERRPKEKLDGFFSFIEKNFSIDGGCIFVWTPEYNMFRGLNLTWVKKDFRSVMQRLARSLYKDMEELFLPLGANSYGDKVLETRKPLYVSDTSKSPYWGDRLRYISGIRSTFTYPLIIRDDMKVIIVFFSGKVNGFSKDFFGFIEEMCSRLSSIVEVIIHEQTQEIMAKSLQRELRHRNHELEILLNMSRQLSFTATFEDALQVVKNLIHFGIKYDFFAMIILSHNIKKIFIYPYYVLSKGTISKIKDEMIGKIYNNGKYLVQAIDLYIDIPMYDNVKCVKYINEMFFLPINIKSSSPDTEILFCIGRDNNKFSKEEIRFINLVGTQLTITFLRIIESQERERFTVQKILYDLPEGVILLDSQFKILLFNKLGEEYISKYVSFKGENRFDSFKGISIQDIIGQDRDEIEVEVTDKGDYKILKLVARQIEVLHEGPWWILLLSDVTENRQMQKKIYRMLEETVYSLAMAIERRDPYTAGHQKNVAQLAVKISENMGLDKELIHCIYLGALLHDLGKIAIPAEILTKPGKLSREEFALIMTHPRVGYEILKNVEFTGPIKEMVLYHHERLDGSGYPTGIKGDKIPLEARILAVADVVEAISSHRPYRPSLGLEVALEEIKRGRGKLFDKEVVDACLMVDFSKIE